MAYAKLSGTLLVRKDAPVAEIVSVPHVVPAPTVRQRDGLLAQRLKALNLPTFLAEYEKVARQCTAEGLDHSGYLLRLAELELVGRERRILERRIKRARFPAMKRLDSFNFAAVPALDKDFVLELARCVYVAQRENIILVGKSGSGKTHLALGLGLAACEQGLSVCFLTAASLMHQLLETRGKRDRMRLRQRLASYKLLIVDELGYVPLSSAGAELMFEVISQRYERGSTIITSSIPLDEWITVFGTPRLTAAVLDLLPHHAHIIEIESESYRPRFGEALRPQRHGNGIEREERAG